MRALLCAALLAPFLASGEARAERDGAAEAVRFALEDAVLPAHERFAESAAAGAAAAADLCKRPSAQNLRTTRGAFARMVRDFSHLEMFRFGPARVDNRHERLFFWPDRRGRGARQTQNLIREQNPDAADPEKLRAKSAAVQGLPALDILLHGEGAEALAQGDAARCGHAAAAALLIRASAKALRDEWKSGGGWAARMTRAGADNPLYRSGAEALAEMFRAMRDQVRAVREFKITAALGKSPEKIRASAAPFRRSGMAAAAMRENIAAVLRVSGAMNLESLLPDAERGLARQLEFELSTFRRLLAELEGADWKAALSAPESREKLQSALVFLRGAEILLARDIPAALGIAPGFGGFDGD